MSNLRYSHSPFHHQENLTIQTCVDELFRSTPSPSPNKQDRRALSINDIDRLSKRLSTFNSSEKSRHSFLDLLLAKNAHPSLFDSSTHAVSSSSLDSLSDTDSSSVSSVGSARDELVAFAQSLRPTPDPEASNSLIFSSPSSAYQRRR
ncbi:hypothetical protein K7432_014404 [Basidiobolus ranarum]|uniref:Uncharacterized protein n=1 Tax=Basidiobolus ranarum TaxID=34480 RepID=A0ABR2WHS1_9FUNG